MKFTNLCQQHDTLCCPGCLSKSGEHSICTTLLLQEVIKTVKSPTLLQSVAESLKNLEIIISNRQRNIQVLHNQQEEIKKETLQIKGKVINHLYVIDGGIKLKSEQQHC